MHSMHSMHSCCKEVASKNTMAERVAERNTQESNPRVDSHCAMAIERLTQVLHRTKMNQADQALCAPQISILFRTVRMLEPSAHNGKPPTKRNTAHLGKGNQQPCQHALETNNPMQGSALSVDVWSIVVLSIPFEHWKLVYNHSQSF